MDPEPSIFKPNNKNIIKYDLNKVKDIGGKPTSALPR
jgi:hypothetical protein